MTLTPKESAVLAWLDAQAPAMVQLLQRIVDIDSGSYDKAGVDAVGQVLQAHLIEAGLDVEVLPGRQFGDGFAARLAAADGRNEPGHVLLMGHRDTVFPAGEAARRPFRIEDGKAYGPGVADMKAGLVLNSFVMAALEAHGGAPLPVVALYTADEEIASPEGRGLIETMAREAKAVFNAEPGRPTGSTGGGIVTSRNGALFQEVEITGVPAHSGANHKAGRSAIEAMAQKIVALHALTDYAAGVTVNVGLAQGGEAVNTVAPSARFAFDVRVPTMAAYATAEAAVDAILRATHVAGTTTRVVSRRAFLPVEEKAENQALFEHYQRTAGELGLTVQAVFSGGSADSGFTSALGVPTICGTGPIGERAHTPEEVCHLATLVPRAQALALAVLRLSA
ncbi:MAG: M20 family peptidase [Geminicoccaceae bacterium]|nr:MAG: M20 family peptidase [Geminicoccaceae bacterium]